MTSSQKYKIKLGNGRILGPIDIGRVRLLIIENQIHGQELAREHPQGEWMNINLITAIGELLVAQAQNRLTRDANLSIELTPHDGPMKVEAGGTTRMIAPPPPEPAPKLSENPSLVSQVKPASAAPAKQPVPEVDNDRTQVGAMPEPGSDATSVDSGANGENISDGATQVVPRDVRLESSSAKQSGNSMSLELQGFSDQANEVVPGFERPVVKPHGPAGDPEPTAMFRREIQGHMAEQATVMLEKPLSADTWSAKDALNDPKRLPLYLRAKFRNMNAGARNALVTGAVIYAIFSLLSNPQTNSNPTSEAAWVPYKPTLPVYTGDKPDPAKSAKLYAEALRFYVQDTVPGYKGAAERFQQAIRFDNQNTKAQAMLASCYLNLIDSSNKDENYFSVISKLIEQSRVKDVDLPETVIADVEFYIFTNKPEAAQNRIVEYTRTRPNFGQEMFYYLSLAFFQRGDITSANRFSNEYRSKPFSAKIYYLRGQIAEKLGDNEAAIHEYQQAVEFNPRHAKSRLAIVRILASQNKIQEGAKQLEFLTEGHHRVPKDGAVYETLNEDGTMDDRKLLAPQELAQAYALNAQLSELHNQIELALAQMQRAIRLDPENHDLLLDYYTLRAKHGEKLSKIQPEARMYYFLGEGEKFIKAGDYHAALSQFLLAREQMPHATLPLVKIGDMFYRIHDLTNARANYKQAADRAPKNIEVWTKYINTLIQSYEWDEAESAMNRFRQLPVPQSAIDKAAADMYAKEGRQAEAQDLYRKAMQRPTIDPSVYIAYAKSLIATRSYKDAPFFFALALRFDPLNIDAIVGNAKCIAATESIDRAINYLQDELQKGVIASAELNAAIAELQVQKGAWGAAQQFVNQAIQANPDYALPYYLQAQIYLNGDNTLKDALDRALDSFNSYSDRNLSDPTGYLERYRIFVKKGMYEKAAEELNKIYAIYPKYPNLHFYKGALYSIMGNHRSAIDEYGTELKYNATSVITLVALGKEYLQMGGASQALQLFQKAMQLNPQSAEARAEAANANASLKNYQGAVALYLSAIALDKGNPNLYKRAGMLYRDLGDGPNASKMFTKYLEMEPDAPDKAEIERYR